MAQCVITRHNGGRCTKEAVDGLYCKVHAPRDGELPAHLQAAIVEAPASADNEPAPPAPADPLALVERRLAHLRDERDRAEEEAAAALARSNRVARELIDCARERLALLASAAT